MRDHKMHDHKIRDHVLCKHKTHMTTLDNKMCDHRLCYYQCAPVTHVTIFCVTMILPTLFIIVSTCLYTHGHACIVAYSGYSATIEE